MRSFYDLSVRRYDPQEYEIRGSWIENRFSNFKYLGNPIDYRGYTSRCLELPFQAAKNPDALVRDMSDLSNNNLVTWLELVYKIGSPGRVRQLARPTSAGEPLIGPRKHWDCMNLAAMESFLRSRWMPTTKDSDWLKKRVKDVLDDMDNPLLEISNWGDNRWGVLHSTFEGRNALGRLLFMLGCELVETNTLTPGLPEDEWIGRQIELVELLNGMPDGGEDM